MRQRIWSYVMYALRPGRSVAPQIFARAGVFALLSGLLGVLLGSAWAGLAMLVLGFLAGLFFMAGLRLYLASDQPPELILGDAYVRSIPGYVWEGEAPVAPTKKATDFVNIDVRNMVPSVGTRLEVRDAYASVRVLAQNGVDPIKEFQARWPHTGEDRITLTPNSFSHGIDLVAKHPDSQWCVIYNNESLRARDLDPFRIETNQFKLEVTIMGENYRGASKTFHVVSHGAGGGLEVKP
jgi:hypothetical protein